MIEDFTPQDFQMPAKFTEYRPAQLQAVEWLNGSDKQISACLLPTGVGKTLTAATYSRVFGGKTCYTVATKALMTQVLSDFRSVGMVELKGRANYPCPAYKNCDAGSEFRCSNSRLETACPYNRAVAEARASEIFVTNYSYLQHNRRYSTKSLTIDLLVCDEAHELENQLTDFAAVDLYHTECNVQTLKGTSGLMDEGEQAVRIRQLAQKKLENLVESTDPDDLELARKLKRIMGMKGNWVWQHADSSVRTVTRFEPIRVSQFTAQLFNGIRRVILMSATLNQFTLNLLLPPGAGYDYRAWSNVFNPGNAPVYFLQNELTRKLGWKSTEEDYAAVVQQADQIISQRLDRKGIIHTVSYARAKRAMAHSIHNTRFLWNDSGKDLGECLERFRKAGPGTVLVTPSVSTGFDFPGSAAEYQIILKFPFPNEQQRVIKERCTLIPNYRLNAAAQTLVQMVGRIRRFEEDRGETFILDSSVRQLMGPVGKSLCPPGFRMFVVTKVPPPPPRMKVN